MRIPTGSFGNVVAQPQQQVRVPNNNAVGNALQNAGQALAGVAQDMQTAVIQKQRAEAASTLALATNEAHDDYDDISRGVQEGRVKPEEAVSEFRKRFTGRTTERTQGLTEDQRTLINDNMIRVSGTLERNLNGVVMKRMQADTDAAILTTGEQLQRQAMRDLPGAIKSWESVVDAVPHWDPAKKAQAKQQFREGATYNFANATLEGAAQTGDISLIQAARAKIEGADGEAIDPAKRVSLITKSYAFESSLRAADQRATEKAQRELEVRENKARDALKDAQDLMLNGRYMSTEYLSQLSDVTAGTSAAPAVQALVKQQAEVAGFASMPLPRQAATIERLRAKGSTPGVGTDPAEQKLIDQMQRIHDGTAKAYAENPWQAAQERAVIREAPVINLANVQDAGAIIAERMKQIGAVEVAAGRKISPLQPQEAETIGRLVRMLPPDQQSSALATFGAQIGDADRLAAFARQIDAKDKVLGTAMMYANSKTTQGRFVSELILRGERAIRDKSITIDSMRETGWRGAIANQIGDAFPNQEVRDRMIDAAYYITAGMASEGSPDVDRAVRMAAGRIVERNGSKVPLPYGMEEDEFDRRLSSISAADLAQQTPGGKVVIGKTSVPLDQFVNSLPDAALVHAGPGRYNVRAGTGLVTNQQGQRITIEVRNAR